VLPAFIIISLAAAVSGPKSNCTVPLADGRITPSKVRTLPVVVDTEDVEDVPASYVVWAFTHAHEALPQAPPVVLLVPTDVCYS
jgi:hypothetical protein